MHGEVKTYSLSPEELEKYRGKDWKPPVKKQPRERRRWEYTTPERPDKRKIPDKPEKPKQVKLCKCGAVATNKGKCRDCYNAKFRERYRMKKELKPPKEKTPQFCEIVENGVVCGIKVHSKGMCSMHYYRNKRNGDPLNLQRGKKCVVSGCEDDTFSNDMCRKHYMDSKGDK